MSRSIRMPLTTGQDGQNALNRPPVPNLLDPPQLASGSNCSRFTMLQGAARRRRCARRRGAGARTAVADADRQRPIQGAQLGRPQGAADRAPLGATRPMPSSARTATPSRRTSARPSARRSHRSRDHAHSMPPPRRGGRIDVPSRRRQQITGHLVRAGGRSRWPTADVTNEDRSRPC